MFKNMNIDFSPQMNPAKFPALEAARLAAKRQRIPVNVYVAPPGSDQVMAGPSKFNVWYVRPASAPAPKNSQLFATENPV